MRLLENGKVIRSLREQGPPRDDCETDGKTIVELVSGGRAEPEHASSWPENDISVSQSSSSSSDRPDRHHVDRLLEFAAR